MQFNSIDYLIFFPIVMLVIFTIPKRLRTTWLLIASYYFYMCWNAKYAVLIGFSTLITYLGAILIEKNRENPKGSVHKGKAILVSTIVINLAILALFKYANFAIETMNRFLAIISPAHISYRFDFLLPVGISFYTFQALGYIIDVYKGDVSAEKNIVSYALFVSFFPQLVAGPIERSKNLLYQIDELKNRKLWDARRISDGFIMIIWGLFLKMVISDRVAIFVDNVFDNYRMFGSTELVAAAVGFSLQIYCDFYSYSTIAQGSACIIGIDLMENFNTPYFASSIRDFWNRWHISLSTWFRDYLYIPLGGNRKGQLRKYINILIVFLVSGLWHGASWNFVIWGGIHGLYQIIAGAINRPRLYIRNKMKINTECFSWHFLNAMCTFLLVVFAWIFFRAESLNKAINYINRIVTKPNPWILFNGEIYNAGLDRIEMNVLIVSVVVFIMVELVKYYKHKSLQMFLFEQNLWFRWGVLITLVLMVFVFGEYGPAFDPKQFIYFQF